MELGEKLDQLWGPYLGCLKPIIFQQCDIWMFRLCMLDVSDKKWQTHTKTRFLGRTPGIYRWFYITFLNSTEQLVWKSNRCIWPYGHSEGFLWYNLKGYQKKDKETQQTKKHTIPSNNATPTQKLYRILVLTCSKLHRCRLQWAWLDYHGFVQFLFANIVEMYVYN